jgi:hypothetical protein
MLILYFYLKISGYDFVNLREMIEKTVECLLRCFKWKREILLVMCVSGKNFVQKV